MPCNVLRQASISPASGLSPSDPDGDSSLFESEISNSCFSLFIDQLPELHKKSWAKKEWASSWSYDSGDINSIFNALISQFPDLESGPLQSGTVG